MGRQQEMENLLKTIENAIVHADRLGLTFAVHILDIARVEVDQAEQHQEKIIPITRPFRKRF
jgi:hypothetical protein